jgi:protein-S-isoprenylcysteine O-methyltransferase Ste14
MKDFRTSQPESSVERVREEEEENKKDKKLAEYKKIVLIATVLATAAGFSMVFFDIFSNGIEKSAKPYWATLTGLLGAIVGYLFGKMKEDK